ncbi:Late embryogenesis abundant protein [Parasponia andersonii]|uniref:Late embryogenesis abundant protein n=1 Tax=Parasponia andersonii TaxID=3476 RepID=A0A2P5D9X4_PARAD|nr:Late embryogenesis abundant protein [Parasponia andersonii]
MSKDCGNHGKNRRKLFRRICAGLLIFNFILLVTILIVWAILQPSKPRFVLQDVTVYAFNTSVPNFLTSNFQVTISSRNPNDKIGVYYDRLDVFAVYHDQQITYRTRIPPTYQGHKDVNVWSPFVYGNLVPVAPFNSLALTQDQSNGAVLLNFNIDGRVRWKVGTFISGRYHFYVKCSAFINLGGNANNGIIVGANAVKYQLVQRCSVNV